MIRIPPHPLDVPGSMKIILGQTASDLIAAHGEYFYASIRRPDATSPPEADGRLVLIVIPMSREQAMDAGGVAVGTHTAKKLRKAVTTATRAKNAASPITP